jgi:hypothetical protein
MPRLVLPRDVEDGISRYGELRWNLCHAAMQDASLEQTGHGEAGGIVWKCVVEGGVGTRPARGVTEIYLCTACSCEVTLRMETALTVRPGARRR